MADVEMTDAPVANKTTKVASSADAATDGKKRFEVKKVQSSRPR